MKKRDFAKRMGKWKRQLTNSAGFSAGLGKKDLKRVFAAKMHHKKLPDIQPTKLKKDPKYSKMSIEEYEEKYGKI